MELKERIQVLANEQDKAIISEKAKKAGLAVGPYVRRAALEYDPEDKEHEAEIESVLERVKHLASEAEAKLDNAIEFIDASEARIAKMEAEHAARMADQ